MNYRYNYVCREKDCKLNFRYNQYFFFFYNPFVYLLLLLRTLFKQATKTKQIFFKFKILSPQPPTVNGCTYKLRERTYTFTFTNGEL